MNIKPLFDNVLIEPIEEEEITKSGILLPNTSEKEKPEQGRVIAVGQGQEKGGKIVPMKVKVGDRVLFSKYGLTEIKVDNKEYLMAKQSDLLAIIE
ncbi:co-chaperone GroES [Patescibacteria group bacterium]|nr:co-chaperone GroES [Patescibacteria group bacterium]